jgi:molybdopterin synthase sulfur carrier subunit
VAAVRVRLFASARDAAGRTADTIEAATLGELLTEARSRYGEQFVAVLERARVWVNGDEPTEGDATLLADDDEVAVLPPVSGGASGRAAGIPRRSERGRAGGGFADRRCRSRSLRGDPW